MATRARSCASIADISVSASRARHPPPSTGSLGCCEASLEGRGSAQSTTVASVRIQLIATTLGDDVPTYDLRLRWALRRRAALALAAARAARAACRRARGWHESLGELSYDTYRPIFFANPRTFALPCSYTMYEHEWTVGAIIISVFAHFLDAWFRTACVPGTRTAAAGTACAGRGHASSTRPAQTGTSEAR